MKELIVKIRNIFYYTSPSALHMYVREIVGDGGDGRGGSMNGRGSLPFL